MEVNFIDTLIGSIFVGILFTASGSRILNCKVPKNVRSILAFLCLVLTITFSCFVVDNALKMMVIYVVALFVNKIIFRKSIIQCAFTSLLSYLILSAGEIFVAILVSIGVKVGLISGTSILKGDVFINLLISLSAYLLLLSTYRKLKKLVINIKENNKFSYIFAFAILLIAICALFYKLFFNNYDFNETFIVSFLLIIAIGYIGIIIIKQSYDKTKISDEYERYVEYSKQTEKLLEQYSISQHENKNELIIIRSMVHKNNNNLLEYLDEIISNKDNIQNSWIRHLRRIPFGGLRGIIHNKVSEMRENSIKVFLDISSEVEKSGLKYLTMKDNNQLSKMIGVFLDNAKEAAMISEEKEVSLCIYEEDKYTVFEISNSFDNAVNIDKIYEAGYSSKGKRRGYGLALVKSIVEESDVFINETKIVKDYFVQKLKVKSEK